MIKNDKKVHMRRAKITRLAILAMLPVIIVIGDILLVGNIGYYTKWAQCGRQPVITSVGVGVGFGAAPKKIYIRQSLGFFSEKAPLAGHDIFESRLHCSRDEAQKYADSISQDVHLQ